MTLLPTAVPDTVWGRLLRPYRRLHAAPDFAVLAGDDWPDRVLGEAVTDRFHAKQGRSIGRWTLTAPDGRSLTVYLKRHHVLPRWRGLLAHVFPSSSWSPGLQEWDHLAWARAAGLPVPRAVAAGEFRGPWGRLQSFLAVEELAGMLPLHEAVPVARSRLSPADFAGWKRRLVAEVARLTRELHRRRAFHKDLYLCHFYLPADDTGRVPDSFRGRVWMIDFHRLGRHRLAAARYQVKDLAQLLFSTLDVPGVTARDRARFWHLYRRGGWEPGRRPPGWLRAAAAWKGRLYLRHNRKRAAE